MRLHILSDLHLEFGWVELPPTDADLVILAGDIHLGREGLRWVQQQLKQHEPSRTIIVTHHAPSLRCEPSFYAKSPLSAAFASILDDFVEHSRVPLWIHGHAHYNVDYKIGRTRVLTNQRGYPGEHCPGFDPGLIVEI